LISTKRTWTSSQIVALRDRHGWSQREMAEHLTAHDSNLRTVTTTVSGWERGHRSPGAHASSALTAVALHAGYPVTVTMHDGRTRSGTLTTESSASSYGLPVVVIGGMAYGSGDISDVDAGDVPGGIRDAATRAGYMMR